MSSKILHERMFSVSEIVDAMDVMSEELRGIRKDELVRLFIYSMKRVNGQSVRYADSIAPLNRNSAYYADNYDMKVYDFWDTVEAELFRPKATYNDQPKSKGTLKVVLDVGMFSEENETFYVVFAHGNELEFDTWDATEKYLKEHATKCRWVTENDRPKSSSIIWADDDDEDLPSTYLTTTLPTGSAAILSSMTNGIISPPFDSSNILRKIPKP